MTELNDLANAWLEDAKSDVKASAVTIKELSNLCEAFQKVKEEIDIVKEELDRQEEIKKDLERKILNVFESSELTNFETPIGKITKVGRSTVKLPATPEERAKFYDYLKSKGEFDGMISVNSNTLNSYVRQIIKNAENDGRIPQMPPGIESYSTHYYLKATKK